MDPLSEVRLTVAAVSTAWNTASMLSAASVSKRARRRRQPDGRGDEGDDLSPTCMSGKEHSER
jgi:hypothetical protein